MQSGTYLVNDGAHVGYIDNNDYLTYNSLNFGPSETTKGVQLRYAKNSVGGKLELRIGGPDGTLIGEFSPATTGGWNTFTTVHIEIDDVIGIQNLTLVGKYDSLMNIDWFELSASDTITPLSPTSAPAPSELLFPKVIAIDYDVQSGTDLVNDGAHVGYIDNNDYLTYNSLNFGPSETTKGVQLRYAKNSVGGKLELRIGGPDGTLIGEFSPATTGGWNTFTTVHIEIDDVIGIQNLTLVGKYDSLMNIDWFELSAYASTPELKDFGLKPLESQLPLQLCEGDCDNDSDCASGLRCFQRNGLTPVPGCSSSGTFDFDYCILVPELKDFGRPTPLASQLPLQLCEGDCNDDSDCASGLRCFQRNGHTPVPRCSGSGTFDYDYCILEPELKDFGFTPLESQLPLQVCEGDCDDDSDCASGLKCFQRNGLSPVPGCSGSGTFDQDYCIANPTPSTILTSDGGAGGGKLPPSFVFHF